MSEREKEEKKKEEEFKIEFLPDDTFKFDKSFNVVLAGNSRTGKSCLMKKAWHNEFVDDYSETYAFEFISSYIKINESIIKLNIWDTSGQWIYKSSVIHYYEKSSLVYSIDDKESFDYIKDLYTEFKDKTNLKQKIILVGNKSDLEEERKISKDEAIKFRNENGFDLFMETSAKTGYNAKNLIIETAKMIYSDNSSNLWKK